MSEETAAAPVAEKKPVLVCVKYLQDDPYNHVWEGEYRGIPEADVAALVAAGLVVVEKPAA